MLGGGKKIFRQNKERRLLDLNLMVQKMKLTKINFQMTYIYPFPNFIVGSMMELVVTSRYVQQLHHVVTSRYVKSKIILVVGSMLDKTTRHENLYFLRS